MHPYIPHLLEDIANAHRTDNGYKEPDEELSFEEEMEAIERWCEGTEPTHTFGYFCALEAVNFPPAAQLNTAEIILVSDAFKAMMFTWNIGIDLPDAMPPHIQYGYLVDTLNKETEIVNSGFMHFDFCTGYAPDCELKEYCPCLKIWADVDLDDDAKPMDEDDCPF